MTESSQLRVYQTLNRFLRLENVDHAYWWRTVAKPLAVLMETAEYDTQCQYQHLLFFYETILPALGPSPLSTHVNTWTSFMTDNHTPVELSLCWNSQGVATTKFAIEPIATNARSVADPLNLKQMQLLVESMNYTLSSTHDVEWYRILERELTVRDVVESTEDRHCSLPVGSKALIRARHTSQYFAAVDLIGSDAVLKTYFLPELKAAVTGQTKLEVVNTAINALGGHIVDAWSVIKTYLSELSAKTKVDVEIVATDCLKPRQSRVKVYVRSRATSFHSVRDMVLLGGRLQSHISTATIDILSELWRQVLGISPAETENSTHKWERNELPFNSHPTAGILFYFEMRLDSPTPWPKVYIPVRHYSANDNVVAGGLETFMGHHDQVFGDWSCKYQNTIRQAFAVPDLASSRGVHTYVTFAFKSTGWELNSYFNPGWNKASHERSSLPRCSNL